MLNGTSADLVERLIPFESEDVVVLFDQCAVAFERIYSLLIACRETVSTLECGRFLQLKDCFLAVRQKYVQSSCLLCHGLRQLTADDPCMQTLLVCLVILGDLLARRKFF